MGEMSDLIPADIFEPKTFTFTPKKLGVSFSLSDHFLVNGDLRSSRSHLSAHVHYSLEALIATWVDPKPIIYPTTWWDAVKHRWFPDWALRRWPVHYTRHEALTYLPEIPPSLFTKYQQGPYPLVFPVFEPTPADIMRRP
jgi:hypothetical protein